MKFPLVYLYVIVATRDGMEHLEMLLSQQPIIPRIGEHVALPKFGNRKVIDVQYIVRPGRLLAVVVQLTPFARSEMRSVCGIEMLHQIGFKPRKSN